MSAAVINITCQHGPQKMFAETTADLAIYGGAAGGGKTHAMLLEPLRHYENGKFGCVIFRRNTVQVRNEGGLWHASENLYTQLGGHPREAFLEWTFPSGARVKFAHLEYDKTVHDYQGSEIPFIGFDELCHFSEKQFWYMLSRNRSTSGVPGYIRATCNPDSDSWVRRLIDWYIGADGFAIKERSGVIRWFVRLDDSTHWADSQEELLEKFPSSIPKSFTFIASSVFDNKILMEKDPSYLANLQALSRVDRMRLLGGNWNIRPTAGNYFQKDWFPVIDFIPAGWTKCVRAWDKAATKPTETNQDPDWTRGIKLYFYATGKVLVADMRSLRDSPSKVESLVYNTASQDGVGVEIIIEQDPGSAGVADVDNFMKLLRGYIVRVRKPTKAKEIRAKPVSAQAEFNNVIVLKGSWNDAFFAELENFPDGAHDDIVDALSTAYNEINNQVSILNVTNNLDRAING